MRVLVVDDDDVLRITARTALESRGYTVIEACDGQQAIDLIDPDQPFDGAILDVNMPKRSGLDVLQAIKDVTPETTCFVMTAYSNVQDAVTAIKHGAYDYLEKPVDAERILNLIDSAQEASSLVEQISFSAPMVEFDKGKNIIGGSSSITKVFGIVHRLAKVDTSVLVRGESGTGKELVARAIHFNSHRKKGPFVAVNCAAIPENLIESELFGHEKGAFTGADRKKVGRFQFAEGGTIFLDEIGDISQQMQVKLLRVLQERKITPVGSNQEINIDVRVVAATNRPLEKMIDEGDFRADLFYRLNVVPIKLPPLRDRKEDVPSLVQFMVNKYNKLHKRSVSKVEPDAMDALVAYKWPGNIRELENVIEHSFVIEASDCVTKDSLPDHIKGVQTAEASAAPKVSDSVAGKSTSAQPSKSGSANTAESLIDSMGMSPDSDEEGSMLSHINNLNYPSLKEQFEREFLIRALKAHNGRINQTAEQTKMTKVTLLRKLEKYGINPKQFH